jgi:hypothetical protein
MIRCCSSVISIVIAVVPQTSLPVNRMLLLGAMAANCNLLYKLPTFSHGYTYLPARECVFCDGEIALN